MRSSAFAGGAARHSGPVPLRNPAATRPASPTPPRVSSATRIELLAQTRRAGEVGSALASWMCSSCSSCTRSGSRLARFSSIEFAEVAAATASPRAVPGLDNRQYRYGRPALLLAAPGSAEPRRVAAAESTRLLCATAQYFAPLQLQREGMARQPAAGRRGARPTHRGLPAAAVAVAKSLAPAPAEPDQLRKPGQLDPFGVAAAARGARARVGARPPPA